MPLCATAVAKYATTVPDYVTNVKRTTEPDVALVLLSSYSVNEIKVTKTLLAGGL